MSEVTTAGDAPAPSPAGLEGSSPIMKSTPQTQKQQGWESGEKQGKEGKSRGAGRGKGSRRGEKKAESCWDYSTQHGAISAEAVEMCPSSEVRSGSKRMRRN